MRRHILVVRKGEQTYYIAYPAGDVALLCQALINFAESRLYNITSADVETIIAELFNRVDIGEVEEVAL